MPSHKQQPVPTTPDFLGHKSNHQAPGSEIKSEEPFSDII